MNAELTEILMSLSGRLAREGVTQIIARFRNGRQQIYRLTPSAMPRSPTQRSNSDRFRTASALATAIYHDPEQRALWQAEFDQEPGGYHKLYNYILARLIGKIN